MIWTITLVLHIAFGSIALMTGTIAIFSTKGSKSHIFSGRIFAVSMITVAISALILATLHFSLFFLSIGIFTCYMTFSGWFWISRFGSTNNQIIMTVVGTIGILTALILLFIGIFPKFNVIPMVFGGLQLSMASTDLFIKPKSKLQRHISRMGGSYIAAVTAFVVVNVDFLPEVVVWIVPSVIGTVLITKSIRKFVPNDRSTT